MAKINDLPLLSNPTADMYCLVGKEDLQKVPWSAIMGQIGAPYIATTAAGMTDKTRVYVYQGSESGYTSGNWYYWNGSAWTSGGTYNSAAVDTDKTLEVSGKAADAKATGDAIKKVKESLKDVELKDGGVTTAKIADKAVTADKLGDDVTAKISSDQWQDLEDNEVFTIGNPDIDFTEDNLAGWFDFSKYPDGYTGEVIDQYGEMSCAINDIDKSNEYTGFKEKTLRIGLLTKSAGTVVSNIMPVFHDTDANKVYRNYPYSLEFYGKFFSEFVLGSANTGTLNSEFNPKNKIIYSTRASDSSFGTTGNKGSLIEITSISDNDTTINIRGAVGQGNATFTLPYKIKGKSRDKDTDKYYHFVLCLDSKLIKLYVDGVLIGSSEVQNNDILYKKNTEPAILFSPIGYLKMARFYKSVLTDEEVALNYKKTVAKYGGGN